LQIKNISETLFNRFNEVKRLNILAELMFRCRAESQ